MTLAGAGNSIYTYINEGLFQSSNNGGNWSTPVNGLPNTMIYQMISGESDLFAGTLSGVYISTDNGASWNMRNSGITRSNITSMAIAGNNIFASSLSGGVYLSINDGITWTEVSDGFTTKDIRRLEISGNYVIASAFGHGIYRRLLSDFDVLDVSTNHVFLQKSDNSTATFDIRSNVGWTVTSSETWLRVSAVSGTGNATITLTADANTTVPIRTTTVTVTGTGMTGKTIIADQYGITTGVNEAEMSDIVIYPNPAKNTLTVTGIPEKTMISVYNSQGFLVISDTPDINVLDISNLPKGLYIIKFQNQSLNLIRRFVKE
jgi:hypothetical protein